MNSVQTNSSQRSFQPSMRARIAALRSLTDVEVPRRMAWRVMMPKKISTMFSQYPEVGVKCSVISDRGLDVLEDLAVDPFGLS